MTKHFQSRVGRRMGTKAPRQCPRCQRRIIRWKYVAHQKRHLRDDARQAMLTEAIKAVMA